MALEVLIPTGNTQLPAHPNHHISTINSATAAKNISVWKVEKRHMLGSLCQRQPQHQLAGRSDMAIHETFQHRGHVLIFETEAAQD